MYQTGIRKKFLQVLSCINILQVKGAPIKAMLLYLNLCLKFNFEYIVSHVNLQPYLFLLISVMNYVSGLLLLSLIVYG